MTVLAKGTSQSISVVFLKSVLALFLLTRSLNDKCRIATDILVKIMFLSLSYQEKRIGLKLSRLCLTNNNDRIWLLWNNGGNSFKKKKHAGFFFKISDYPASGRFKPSAKLMTDKTNPPREGDSGKFFRMQIVTMGWMVGRL